MILLGRLSLYGQGAERLHEELIPVTARWVEPSQRKNPLQIYARDAEARTLDLLEGSLEDNGGHMPNRVIQQKLLAAAEQDIKELRPWLEPRAMEWAEAAIEKLQERGEREARDLQQTLEQQRKRVQDQLDRHERDGQQKLALFGEEEKRQLEADVRSWHMRLEQFERDLESEPQRIRSFYEVKARRIEPVGLIYLWPETN